VSDLAGEITEPAQQPDKQNGKQGADAHGQSYKKPDLLLMQGQTSFWSASMVVSHIYYPG
jgi:hypothetical protein